jgi:hypothetical protein
LIWFGLTSHFLVNLENQLNSLKTTRGPTFKNAYYFANLENSSCGDHSIAVMCLKILFMANSISSSRPQSGTVAEPQTSEQITSPRNVQNPQSKFVKSSSYLPQLSMREGSKANSRGRVDAGALNSMMLSSPLSKMPARISSSDGFKQSIAGDVSNGHSIREQHGVWSNHGKHLSVSGGVVDAVAVGKGAVGVETEVNFSGNRRNTAYEARGLSWAGANGSGSASASATANGAQGEVRAEGKVGAGVEASAKTKVGSNGIVKASTAGRALVGAESTAVFAANVKGTPGGLKRENSVKAEVGAFAGAKAEGTAQVDVKGNTIGVKAAALAGVGANATFHASVEKAEDGNRYLAFKNNVAVAAGVGAGFGVKTRINVESLVKLVGMVEDGIRILDGVQNIGSALKGVKKS